MKIDTLNPRDEENKLKGEPLEELENLILDSNKPGQVLHIQQPA